ncbi:MAG: glycine cleavage system aminomethyltransferase GcvT [Dethiobacter sp.]|jgi:aminomethyltransferase|nr:glycine cleavage system aminomethyltransferase GcvT [Dethiobacter sp.]
MSLRRTPFYGKHIELKGKMVDFLGWSLPVQYEGIIAEVQKVRQSAGIFDVSHMGEILVEGKGALPFLQKIATNDISRLKAHGIMYSPVCYSSGGTVDDILIYCYNPEKYLLVVNASNAQKDLAWLKEHCSGIVTVRDISEDIAQIALQGPNSLEILLSLTDKSLAVLKYYTFVPEARVAGIKCLISRTGYTGEDGFEVYCQASEARELWGEIWSAGGEDGLGLAAAGLGARDILRLEAALPLYGHELTADITPLDAGLDRFVSFTKGINFIGRGALVKQKEEGTLKRLCGLEMLERGIAREGYSVRAQEEEVGWVSSGSYSPTLDKAVALAFLNPEHAPLGNQVQVVIRGREYNARVVKIPFYRREK